MVDRKPEFQSQRVPGNCSSCLSCSRKRKIFREKILTEVNRTERRLPYLSAGAEPARHPKNAPVGVNPVANSSRNVLR